MSRFSITRPPARPGFTIIELMLVLAIIGILISLSVAGVMKVASAQQVSLTRTVETQLASQVGKSWSAVADKARNEAPSGDALSMAGGNRERAKVIHLKLRLRQAFPISFQEVLDPSVSPASYKPLPVYQTYLSQAGVTSAAYGQPWESSACLLMALQRGPSGTGINLEDLGVGSAVKSVTVAGTSNIQILTDSWGNPFVFSRWPNGDASGVSPVNPSGYQPVSAGYLDPGDPKGELTRSSWVSSAGAATFSKYHPLIPAGNSLNLTPRIVSSGPDGALGLSPASLAITNASQARDNIYSKDNP